LLDGVEDILSRVADSWSCAPGIELRDLLEGGSSFVGVGMTPYGLVHEYSYDEEGVGTLCQELGKFACESGSQEIFLL
jgi:hypothetical protein